MKKKGSYLLAVLCYALGILASIYVGAWLMLIQPIHQLLSAFSSNELTFMLLVICIIKIALSTTFAGFVWCIGYIGYNHFKGKEDPEWDVMTEEKSS